MRSERLLNIISFVAAGLAAFIVGFLLLSSGAALVDSFTLEAPAFTAAQSVVNFSHNSYFLWQADPFWQKFFGITSNLFYVNILLVVFTLGSYILLSTRGATPLKALSVSLLLTVSVCAFFGPDCTILGTVSYFPWLLLAAQNVASKAKPSFLALVFLLFISIRLAQSGLYLGIIPVSLAMLFIRGDKYASVFYRGIYYLILLLPTLYFSLTVTPPLFPDYPFLHAGLVPDDGVPGFTRPNFGPELPLPVIDIVFIKDTYLLPVLLLGLIVLWVRQKAPRNDRSLLFIASLLCLVALEVTLPENLSQLAPLSTLSRNIPGLYLISLTPIIFALILCILSYFFNAGLCAYVALLLLILLPRSSGLAINTERISFPKFARGFDFSDPLLFTETQRERIMSPSFHILSERGLSILNKEWITLPRKKFSLSKLSPKIIAYQHQADTIYINDHNPETRWSTKSGAQTGAEWLYFTLPNQISADGIFLNLGSYTSDFPRGLRISVANSCTESAPSDLRGFSTIVDYNRWLGPSLITPNGYPYYGPQSHTQVLFPQTISFRCMMIEQTGQDSSFDWSIAEIGLLSHTTTDSDE